MDNKGIENLTTYPNLSCIEGLGTAQLLKQLEQITLPYQIVSMYASGENHYAWITTSSQIKIEKIKKSK